VTVLAICAARRSGDARAEAISMRRLGELHWQQAKAAISLRYLTSAASRFSALGDDVELARTLIVQADIFADTGRAREARDRLSDALALAARAGDSLVQAAALDQLGSALSDAGEFAAAQRCFKEALQLSRSDDRIAIRALKRRADVLRRGGRYDQSAVLLREALTAARRSGDIHWEAHVLRSLGEAQRYVGDTREARRSLVRSLELFNENGHRHAVAYSLRSLADLHAQLREYEQAAEALETCRTMFEDLADRRGQAYTLRSLGGLCVRTGRLPQAEQALRAALSIFDDLSLRWFSQDAARALARTRNQRLLQKT
jgi:tetratricopeptide (TPR) repeat protein